MPLLKIVTNVPRSQVPADFLAQATEIVAEAIGKPARVGYLQSSGIHWQKLPTHSRDLHLALHFANRNKLN